MSWSDVRDAVQRAIMRGAQLGADKVLWKYFDTDQPPLDYVSLSLGNVKTLGLDYLTSETDLTRPNGQEVAMEVKGQREVNLEIECFSASVADSSDALALAELIRSSLLLPTVRNLLAGEDISPFDPGPVQYVPSIVSVGFRGRAICTVRCYVPAQAVIEYAGYIAKVEGTVTAHGTEPDPLTEPFIAP